MPKSGRQESLNRRCASKVYLQCLAVRAAHPGIRRLGDYSTKGSYDNGTGFTHTTVSEGFFMKCLAIFFRQENVNQKYETHSVQFYFIKQLFFLFLCEGRQLYNNQKFRGF